MHPFDATLEHLREQFVAGAQQRVRRISDLVLRLGQDSGDTAALEDLRQHAHRLAGAAATYGYPELARNGQEIVAAARELVASDLPVPERTLQRWQDTLAVLRLTIGRAHSGAIAPLTSRDLEPDGAVLLIMAWGPARERLARVLQAQGLRVRTASDRATARRALRNEPPDALVIDLAVQGGTVMQVVETLREQAGGDRTVVLFLTTEGRFDDRLEAIRAGADAVLEGEALPERVSAKLQELLRRQSKNLGHVLYLEGDPDQAAYVERLLRAAGYHVTVCIDPARFGETVAAVAPDLVLMVMVLPGVRGVDVARALRQEPRYHSLPLLFLTTDSVADGGMGEADGWLKKPIEPRLLLSTIDNHLQRARLRAELREFDSATNLVHHAAFERQLSQWMTTGDPARVPCALAIVDLDVTAEINARFGHALCDDLLRGLGQSLQSQVRGAHICGRYDGDAFALLILDQSEEDIEGALDELRATFASAERYAPDGRVFQANFSVGVARYQPGWRRPQLWLAATEDAVRAAKQKGGGRVTLASGSDRPALNVPRLRSKSSATKSRQR